MSETVKHYDKENSKKIYSEKKLDIIIGNKMEKSINISIKCGLARFIPVNNDNKSKI